MPSVIRLYQPGLTQLVATLLERDPARIQDTPHIALLYTKADILEPSRKDIHRRLAEHLHVDITKNMPFPYAALARFAETGEMNSRFWLNASPVSYTSARAGLVMNAVSPDELGAECARSLAMTLNTQVFGHYSLKLETSPSGYWYLDAESHPEINTHPMHTVNLTAASHHLPQGEDRLFWSMVLGEVEMVLHGNALNSEDNPGIDGIWLWGEGRMPAKPHGPETVARIHLATHDLALQGLAKLAERPYSSPAPAVLTGEDNDRLDVVLDETDWGDDPLAHLRELNSLWFKPAIENMRKRRGSVFVVEDPGQPTYRLCRACLKRWWRRKPQIKVMNKT